MTAINTRTRIASAENNGVRMGKGLFATTSINKGEDILTVDTPLVAIVEQKLLPKFCSGCFDNARSAGKMNFASPGMVKACTKCRVVYYCNKQCQSKDWKLGHQLECPIYAALYPKILPSNVRAILRILLRHRSKKISKEEYEGFLDLTYPDPEHLENLRLFDALLMAQAVKHYGSFDDLDELFIQSLFGRLNQNSFTLTSAFGNNRGIYLHPYTARMNHSCDYNATYSFDGGKCYVKAIRPIAKDEQIFVPYTDTTFSVGTRRRELVERFGFTCQCTKCTHEINAIPAKQVEQRAAEELEANNALDEIDKESKSAEDLIKLTKRLLRKTESNLDWHTVYSQRQPLSAIRVDLMRGERVGNECKDSFLNAAIEHLRSDPVLYPDENHPVRRDHAMVFAQEAYFAMVVDEYHSPQRAPDADANHILVREKVDLNVILWSVANWMVNGTKYMVIMGTDEEGEGEGEEYKRQRAEIVWPNPTMKLEADKILAMAINSCRENRTMDRGLNRAVKENWDKLERIVDETLREEMNNAV